MGLAHVVRNDSLSLELPPLTDRTGDWKELRLWYLGLFGTRLLRFWQDSTGWHVCRSEPWRAPDSNHTALNIPSDTVAATWDAAVGKGLLRLPRFPDRGETTMMVHDGIAYVLESYDGRRYRVAEADNPEDFNSTDDRRIVSVVGAIEKRWNIDRVARCSPSTRRR